ncbi:hypothetical protein MMC06_006043 [Schaereria dolodes]|nr:hypothetical protein [Schaereria dolodes]
MSYLSKKDLKPLRLVCKRFDLTVIPYLFDHIIVALNAYASDLDAAKGIAKRFAQHVKKLTIVTQSYSIDTEADYITYYLYVLQETKGVVPEASYKNYQLLKKKQRYLINSGEDLSFLCWVFAVAPRIQNIEITDFHPKDYDRTFKDRKLMEVHDEDQKVVILRPGSAFEVSRFDPLAIRSRGFRALRILWQALFTSENSIKCLCLRNEASATSMPMEAFDLLPHDIIRARKVFCNLH